MKININRNRGNEVIGEIKNDENKDYWLLIKVSPTGIETPATQLEEPTIKVAVCDGLARVVDQEFIQNFYESRGGSSEDITA
jgi:hypothetical protein